MSWLDRFRRPWVADPGGDGELRILENPDFSFTPRTDGDYRCDEAGLILRFARPVVTETDGVHDEPANGEYTNSGRFAVQRPFERPVVYTAVNYDTDPARALRLRRTDTNNRSSSELMFHFVPDNPVEYIIQT